MGHAHPKAEKAHLQRRRVKETNWEKWKWEYVPF